MAENVDRFEVLRYNAGMNTYRDDPTKGLSKLQKEILDWIFTLPRDFDPELVAPSLRPVNVAPRRPDFKPRRGPDTQGLRWIGKSIIEGLFKSVHPHGAFAVDRDVLSRALRRLEQRGLIVRYNRFQIPVRDAKLTPRQTFYVETTEAAEEWFTSTTSKN
jgi:hypothetical protein